MKKTNSDDLTNLVFDAILKIFDENDSNMFHPDELNDPEQLTRFLYAISITGPHAFFNFLATKKITEKEFYDLMGEVMNELKSP